MRRIGVVTLVLGLLAAPAGAQHTRESWKVGVTASAGFPAALGGFRFSAPLAPKAGIDLIVGTPVGKHGNQPGDGYGRMFISHIRWIHGGRDESGASRYLIFGVMGMRARWSTPIIYPGNVRTYLVTDDTLVGPRVGYGWDGITRRGTRVGVELTTGAVGEERPVMFANAFVMWGPPRR
jgi:hypothetical protein